MDHVRTQNRGSATLVIVESIAEQEEIEPVDLRPPLEKYVDTTALDRVVGSLGADDSVEFEYREYEVTIYGDGDVAVASETTK